MTSSSSVRPRKPVTTTNVTGPGPTAMETSLKRVESVGPPHASLSHQKIKMPICSIVACEYVEKQRFLAEAQRITTYYIHQEDNIFICSNFLAGKCFQGSLCPRHHTMLPYAWQMRDTKTKMWVSVEGSGQEMLERLYSNPHVKTVKAMCKKDKLIINLLSMEVYLSSVFDRVRRLSTLSNPTVPFNSCLKYYYEASLNQWVEYGQETIRIIEESLRENCYVIPFNRLLSRCYLDICNLLEEDLETGTKRRIRIRPVFVSPITLMSKLWTMSAIESPTCLKPFHPSVGVFYPGTWRITSTSVVLEKVLLDCKDEEYHHVYRNFHKTIPEWEYLIVSVNRIQNYFQWEKLMCKKRFMTRFDTEYREVERFLFHGTDQSNVDAICTQNFDTRVDTRNGKALGYGCYFAKDASYSHRYCPANASGHRYMFLAKVLVGRSTVGCASYRRPPMIIPDDPKSLLYDSCVNKLDDPDLYVVFDNDQFYPSFLIEYKKVLNFIVLD
uniref:Poly [ADP-ribose] polymerase n=1 Tax=Leptobrachium leishanense TaxID=445787 RepID=A0A8C5MBV6_9ANUR